MKLKWGEITHEHDGLIAKVYTGDTQTRFEVNDIWKGMVRCPTRGAVPHLVGRDGNKHIFEGWWDVEFVRD